MSQDLMTMVRPTSSGSGRASDRLRVLVVDSDPTLFHEVARCATAERVHVEYDVTGASARRRMSQDTWDLVFIRLRSSAPARELSRWLRRMPSCPRGGRAEVVAVTEHRSLSLTLRAVRLGVRDVLFLPLEGERIRQVLGFSNGGREDRAVALPPVEPHRIGSFGIVTEHPRMLEIYTRIARIAPCPVSVLLLGESGTGKEIAARAIHALSDRARGPFVAVNCAAIPEGLLESELFGHEPGAFTGAVQQHAGRFEWAHGGTLFLDEIGDMSLALQSKILRALNDGRIERLGGRAPLDVDVRIIAATNTDLRRAIRDRRFRRDLYYRIAVVSLRLPRLRDRGRDLLLLIAYFVREFNARHGRRIAYVSEAALNHLQARPWHGNVRELRNVIEQAVVIAHDDTITLADLATDDLDPEEAQADEESAPDSNGFPTLREVEARYIARVLAHTGGQVAEASRILGIHRNTLARKIREQILT